MPQCTGNAVRHPDYTMSAGACMLPPADVQV